MIIKILMKYKDKNQISKEEIMKNEKLMTI